VIWAASQLEIKVVLHGTWVGHQHAFSLLTAHIPQTRRLWYLTPKPFSRALKLPKWELLPCWRSRDMLVEVLRSVVLWAFQLFCTHCVYSR